MSNIREREVSSSYEKGRSARIFSTCLIIVGMVSVDQALDAPNNSKSTASSASSSDIAFSRLAIDFSSTLTLASDRVFLSLERDFESKSTFTLNVLLAIYNTDNLIVI